MNFIYGDYASLLGGKNNSIGTNVSTPANYSVIVGGDGNTTVGEYSAILGGRGNTVSDSASTIIGGRGLTLNGSHSFGFRAENGSSTLSVSAPHVGYLGNVDLWLANDDDLAHQLRFYEASGSGSNYTAFKATTQSANISYILPSVQGIAGNALINDGSGNLSWGPGLAQAWQLLGNSGTSAGTNYLGTSDNQAFEIHVYDSDAASKGSKRVMRYEPKTSSANIIGGYSGNKIISSSGSYIGSGGATLDSNVIDHGDFNIIVGGKNNRINLETGDDVHHNSYSVIVGGQDNYIQSYATDTAINWSVIVGGKGNRTQEQFAFIGGGQFNRAIEDWAFVGGGRQNEARDEYSAVGGGAGNLADGNFAAVLGGLSNTAAGQAALVGGGHNNIAGDAYASLVGGVFNLSDGVYSFVGGGNGNKVIAGSPSSNIVGGDTNRISKGWSSVAGGKFNEITSELAFIGGGGGYWGLTKVGNRAAGPFSSIPGGVSLRAMGTAQTVIGHFNKPLGDSSKNITQLSGNDRLFIVGNGKPPVDEPVPVAAIPSNAFEVSENGHSIVFHKNGAGNPAISGARYIDNTVIAWGEIDGTTPAITAGFGISAVAGGAGVYTINLNYVDPYTGAVKLLTGSSVVATVKDGASCSFITATPVNTASNTFVIRTFKHTLRQGLPGEYVLDCDPVARDFMFVVYGRP